jgi:hypothetical protein
MSTNIKRPTELPQYKINTCRLTTELLDIPGNNQDLFIEIRDIVAEVNIYETLDKPYLTGDLVVMDEFGILSAIKFQGTERITLEINPTASGLDENPSPSFRKTFICSQIKNQSKSKSGKASVYLIKIIEEHGFLGSIKRVRKSYRGSIENTIKKVLKNELGFDRINTTYTGTARFENNDIVQQDINCIVPNLSVNETLSWLCSRITTSNGSPYFLYSTVHSKAPIKEDEYAGEVRLGNLDFMLREPSFNRIPFIYNPTGRSLAMASEASKRFVIKRLELGSSLDISTGNTSEKQYTIEEQINKLSKFDIIQRKKQNIHNPLFKIGEKGLNEYTPKTIHRITSQGTYGQFNSYHDEIDDNKHLNKVSSVSMKNNLHKNNKIIECEGSMFMFGKVKVGDCINVLIVSDSHLLSQNQSDGEEQSENLYDERHSGKHLIYHMKYKFSNNEASITATICKFESNQIEEG